MNAPLIHTKPISQDTLQLEVITTLEGLIALGPQWNVLLRECPARNLFLTPIWNGAWWRAFGAGKLLRLVVLRSGGRLVAIAPYMLYTARMGGFPVRVLGTFTNAHVSRSDVLVAPAFCAPVAHRIAKYFRDSISEWDVARIQQVPAKSAWLHPFLDQIGQEGLLSLEPQAGIGKCHLPVNQSWDSYLHERGTHFRRNIGKTERRLARAGQIAYRHSVNPTQADTDFEICEDVECRSWKGDSDVGAHLGGEGWAFQKEFATAYEDGIRCDNWIVEIDGRPMAIVHTVGYDRVNYCFQTLYDHCAKDLYIGRAAVTQHFQSVFNEGHYDTLDLNGDSGFCKSWSTLEHSFVSFQIFNRRPYSGMLWGLKKIWSRR